MNTEYKKKTLFLYSLMVIYLLGRLLHGNYRLTDSEQYFAVADLLKTGKYFLKTTNFDEATFLTQRPFLYPLLILFPGFCNDLLIILLQTLIGFLNLNLIFKLYSRYGGKSFTHVLIFIVLTPSIFIYTHLIMTEAIGMTLILLLALLLTYELNSRKVLLIQIIVALLIFLKPVFYPFAFVNLALFILYSFRTKKIYYTAIIPLLLTISYMGFNKARTGYFNFSSMQNVNLIDYNLYLFKMKRNGTDSANKWRNGAYERSKLHTSIEARSTALAEEGKKVIKENLLAYSIFHLSGAARGLLDPGRADILTLVKIKSDGKDGFLYALNSVGIKGALQQFLRAKNAWLILIIIPVFICGIIKLIFTVSFLNQNKKNIGFGSVYLIILFLYYIIMTGPVNWSRYMMIFQGILIAAACAGLDQFVSKKWKKGSLKT